MNEGKEYSLWRERQMPQAALFVVLSWSLAVQTASLSFFTHPPTPSSPAQYLASRSIALSGVSSQPLVPKVCEVTHPPSQLTSVSPLEVRVRVIGPESVANHFCPFISIFCNLTEWGNFIEHLKWYPQRLYKRAKTATSKRSFQSTIIGLMFNTFGKMILFYHIHPSTC